VREFLRHGSLVFAGLVGANVFTYVYYATVSRAVGIENAGLFTSLISAMLFLSLPGFVGATVLAKLVADATGRRRGGVAVFLGRRIAWLVCLTALAAFLAATAGYGAVSGFFHAHDGAIVALAAAGFALTFVLAPQRALLQGGGQFSALTLSNVLEGAGKAISGVAVLTVGGGLRAALGGYLVAVAAAVGLNFILTGRGTAPEAPPFQRADLNRVLRGIALPIAATTAMTFVDVILVRHFLRAYEAGLYGAAALVGRAMLTVIAFVPTVLLPKATARVAQGESPVRLLAAALMMTAIVIGGILAVLAVAPAFVVTVISGQAFVAAAPLMLPYGLAMAGLAGALVLSNYLIGIDRHGFALPLTAVAICEAVAIIALHPDIATILHIVITGHLCAFLCCAVDTGFSLRAPRGISPIVAKI
jgi:O-antigen/teichoic acid export membrane protein